MTFALHPQLEADTRLVMDLPLCSVLLMNDARYPWLILVPRIAALRDLHELEPGQRAPVLAEITAASHALERLFQPYKLNVAALGNQVEQLHIHVIARRTDDPAWPGPVWGVGAAEPYSEADYDARLAALVTGIGAELDAPTR